MNPALEQELIAEVLALKERGTLYLDETATRHPASRYDAADVFAGEAAMLRQQPYILPITLGPRILRAETAVVSALTLWQSQVGDWQKAPYLPQT